MQIKQGIKYHLDKTIYFDDDGYSYYTLEEAKLNSYITNEVTVVRKQNCYVFYFEDLPEDLKDFAKEMAEFSDCKVSGRIWITNSKKSELILSVDPNDFESLFSVVNKEE